MAGPVRMRRGDVARLALIEAGERLFALQGLAGTSLRQINEEAGQKNISAAHYYFGSRDGLVEAIFAHRTPTVNQRRIAMLDKMARQDRTLELRSLVSVIISPLVEHIRLDPDASYWIRLIERTLRESRAVYFRVDAKYREGIDRTVSSLSRALSYLPETLATLRIRLAIEQSISGLAFIEASIVDGGGAITSLELLSEALIDSVTGSLVSPVSPRTIAQLNRPHDPELFRLVPTRGFDSDSAAS